MNLVQVDEFTILNLDDVRRLRFDNISEVPAFFVTFKSGHTERIEVESLTKFNTIFGGFLK